MVVTKISQQICLTEYPVGIPADNNFRTVQVEIPEPTKKGILGAKHLDVCRSIYAWSHEKRGKK